MNKAELVTRLVPYLGTEKRVAEAAVEGIMDIIVRAVHDGEQVVLNGFGVFEQRQRSGRLARNPRTGESVTVQAVSLPIFRPGLTFRHIVAHNTPLIDGQFVLRKGALIHSTNTMVAPAHTAHTEHTETPIPRTRAVNPVEKEKSKKKDTTKKTAKKADKKSHSPSSKTVKHSKKDAKAKGKKKK